MREIISTLETANAEFCADLHTHTNFSDGTLTPFDAVDFSEILGMSSLAITDHNRILPSVLAREYAAGRDIEVVVGSEVASEGGHLVVLFQQEDIPRGMSITSTIISAHEQDAVVIAAHPMLVRSGIGTKGIQEILDSTDERVYLDGFEVENKGVHDIPRIRYANEAALKVYLELIKEYPDKIGAAIGDSDNHFFGIGRSRTWYNGNLRDSIKNKQTLVARNTKFEDLNLIAIAYSKYGEKVMERVRRIREIQAAGE